MTAAQSIRSAALSWPLGLLSDDESWIVNGYLKPSEKPWGHQYNWSAYQKRTFMLLVAEELDGGAGRMADSFAESILHEWGWY